MLGGHKQYFLGGVHPEMHSSGTGLLLSFGTQPSLGGYTSCLGGTNSDLGGHGPEMPPWRRAWQGLDYCSLANLVLIQNLLKQKKV